MYICLSLGVGRDCESPAKTVEPSEMPFGLWIYEGPKYGGLLSRISDGKGHF